MLDPEDNVVNLVICHHPPDWFMDYDEVDEAIRGRAAIHLFGHNHRQRITDSRDYIRFSAGAVNPDRHESGWEPGYNLIDVKIAGEGMDRNLEIEAHVLRWQPSPEKFVLKQTRRGEEVFRHRISIPARPCTPEATRDANVPAITAGSAPVHDGPFHDGNDSLEVEAAMSPDWGELANPNTNPGGAMFPNPVLGLVPHPNARWLRAVGCGSYKVLTTSHAGRDTLK